MYHTLNFRKEKKHQALIIFSLTLFILFTVSCGQESQSSRKSESELINKVTAVQQQMMKQGNISEEEKRAILSLASLVSNNDGFDNSIDDAILFDDVENAPIYNGCEGLSEDGTKKCFNESIIKFIKQEFNSNITNGSDISEPLEVEVFFKIDENGNMSNLKVRDADISIQAEIERVLRKIPKMKPATLNGIEVSVLCSILVTYDSEVIIEFVAIPEIG